jgi:arylsulfatase A-like enzyme
VGGSPVRLSWSSRLGILATHVLAGGVAGLATGLVDAYQADHHPGLELLRAGGIYALGTGLAASLGALVGLLVGAVAAASAPRLAPRQVVRWLVTSPRGHIALGVAGALIGVCVAVVHGVLEPEWEAVDWRLPTLAALGLGIYVPLAWGAGLLHRNLRLVLGGAVLGSWFLALQGWDTTFSGFHGGSTAALERLASDSALGRRLLPIAQGLFDGDGDGYATRFCGGMCDSDDADPEVVPGAAEVPDEATRAELDALLHPPPEPTEPPPAALPPAAAGPSAPPPLAIPARPDLVLILIDTVRADHVGWHGYHRPTTPHLDRLAETSASFMQARAAGSQTRFSVPPLLTGKYFTEIDRGESEWPGIEERETLLAERLKAAGYATAGFVALSYMLPMYGMAQGFDHYDTTTTKERDPWHKRTTSDYLTDRVLAFADGGQLRPGAPFFLWVYYVDPHSPYLAHPEAPTFGPDYLDVYDNEIAFTDAQVGRLLDGLRARGLLGHAVVVVTSDHGEALDPEDDHGSRYHGATLYDEVVRVPLLVSGPGVVTRRVTAPVSLLDLAPTFLELAGSAADPTLRGTSLVPWLGGRDPAHPPVFFEKHKELSLPQKGMVLWPYKVIMRLPYQRFEIYDLAGDPRERKDLVATLETETTARLTGLLRHWATQVLEAGRVRNRGSSPSQ